jgi:hypothetical protein
VNPISRITIGACLFCASGIAPAIAQVTFNVSFDATAAALTNTERTNITSHIQEAGRRWSSLVAIDGPRSIEVEIGAAGIPTANGTSVTTFPVATNGSRTVYEQGLAYELISGTDPNATSPDVHFNFGLDYLRNQLWFDPDPTARTAAIPANRVDALSVILHEFGHALVYNGWSDLTTGVSPATYQSTFDFWTTPGAPSVFSGPVAIATWGTPPDLTTGNNKHWGNSGDRPAPPPERIERTPVQWRDGAPVPQPISAPPAAERPAWKIGSPTASLIDELMNGVVFYYQTRYDISALDVAVLEDTGIPLDHIFGNGFED